MKTFFYILGFAAAVVIAIIIFLMIRKNMSAKEAINEIADSTTGGTGSAGTIATGTTIPLGGAGAGTTVVSISELTQKLLSGMPFASNPLILNGTIQPDLVNNGAISSGMLAEKRMMIFNSSLGLQVGGVADYANATTQPDGYKICYAISVDPESLWQGVKFKNLIWEASEEAPYVLRERTGTYGFMPTLGAYYCTMWCKFYFEEGTQKVFPIASPFRRWFAMDRQHWKYIKKNETQILINNYNSTH